MLRVNQFSNKSVFIPRSLFPRKHDPAIELAIQEETSFSRLYQEQNPAREKYILHDGPPFANGPIHLGHAINKILKDIAARYAMITGCNVEFIAGWDCHGLPIELQVHKLIEEQQRQSNYGGSLLESCPPLDPEQFRNKARSYAKSQIDSQMASFKRMGLLTDWNKRYTTDDPSYVANQLRAFSQLYEQKLIYKDLRPVHWSLINKTSVADADIDYRSDHVSKSAYIMYEMIDAPFHVSDPVAAPGGVRHPLYALIWTTTPWTLLENRAIAFNKQETYCIVKAWKENSLTDTKYLLVSYDTMHKLNSLLQRLGFLFEMRTYVPGKSLIGLKYKPLLHDELQIETEAESKPDSVPMPLPFLDAEFVDGAKGTGLVHMAPNYGFDDFALFRAHKQTINRSLVDHDGKYRQEAGDILAGKFVFSNGTQEILSILDQQKALLHTELTLHSYPYETRTNQPIIIRTSQQVFLDTSRIIPRCLKALESCSFYPEHRRQHLLNTLASSPSWCISRQRLWGTPIPVLYDRNNNDIIQKMISHPKLVEHYCKLLYKRRTMDYWWTSDISEIAPQELLDKCKLPYKSEELTVGMDIFDVWSDSGLSWHTAVNGINDNKTQADLYLEGIDQVRGWFSASSILSMALRGCLPTKRFFFHGFALDEHGYKMSKSQGNVIDPVKLFETYGVDTVRLWAARSAGNNTDIRVRTGDIKSILEEDVNKIRNTLKYLIGALADHDGMENETDHTKLQLYDQYFLDKLFRFAATVDGHYKSYRFDLVVNELQKFVTEQLSPIYLNTIKDILYCDELDSERRKSCLTVLSYTYNILLRCLYPLMPHIVHEAGKYMLSAAPLNEWKDLAYKAEWKNDVLHNQVETLLRIRSLLSPVMQSRFDAMRAHDAMLYIEDKKMQKNLAKIVDSEAGLMTEVFKTTSFKISHKEKINADLGILEKPIVLEDTESVYRLAGTLMESDKPVQFELCFTLSNNRKCTRCRRYNLLDDASICDRCQRATQKLMQQNV